jgi:MFS family permease
MDVCLPPLCYPGIHHLRSKSRFNLLSSGGAYLLANATAAPVWVKLSDIWGRKPILLLAVGMYFITSIICAVSTTMKMLIIGRACQGTAGGGLMQLVNVTVSDLFSLRFPLYIHVLTVLLTESGSEACILAFFKLPGQ